LRDTDAFTSFSSTSSQTFCCSGVVIMRNNRDCYVDDIADGDDDEENYEEGENEYEPNSFINDNSEEGDIDDLDITQVVKKDLKGSRSHIADQINSVDNDDTEDDEEDSTETEIEDVIIEDDDDEVEEDEIEKSSPSRAAKASRERRLAEERKEKAAYKASLRTTSHSSSSDDKVGWASENEDGLNEAYLAFKNRKKRKRAASKMKPSKSRAVANNSGAPAVQKRNQPGNRNAIVGRKAPRKQRKEAIWRGPQDQGEEDADLENSIDDEHLPDYLQNRLDDFKAEQARIGNAALMLPPTYDDVEFSDDERMEYLLEKPSLPKLKPCAEYRDILLEYSGGIIPAPIAQWLRDYQVKGAQFLHELFVYQKGGILGDDMGLGKTIQVISFLTAAFGKTGDERDKKRRRKKRRYTDSWYPRVLIVCPASLFANWGEELDRWGWWDVELYHGPASARNAALSAAERGSAEIMITSYDTYKRNMSAINTVNWDCVIADEFHQIKKRTAETTIAMADVNALCRIGLTGTAIQNNYDELFALLNWTNPGKFGSLSSWKDNISNPLRLGQSHNATEWQLGVARKLARSLVDNLLPPFFLRRMKTLIADQLPKKSDRVVFCPLTDVQADAYANYASSPLVEFLRGVSQPCECGSPKTYGSCCGRDTEEFANWKRHVFPTMMTLQKMSCHLAMIIPSKQDSLEKQDKDVEHLKMAFPDEWRDLYAKADNIHQLANEEYCGKWKILRKLLKFWHGNGDKVLIFSHSVKLLRILNLLFESREKYNVCYFDGKMSLEDRAEAVSTFNSDPKQFVFLISTKSGGVGLNITSANKVVIMDPNWNPAYDQQAQDRAYRIGQTRDVEVFRLISAGTIEEIVYARQIYKQQQANIGYTASSERRYFTGIQGDKTQKGEIFGLTNMFSYQGEGVVLQQIVNKTNVAESRLGLSVSEIDMSQMGDDEPLIGDEDAAMKDLEALIVKGESSGRGKRGPTEKAGQKLSAVQAILSNAGVSYTHENSEVVGTSKTELHISRKAAEAATTTHEVANRPVFGGIMRDSDGDGRVSYRYNPPEDVRKRQFCTMAKMFGFRDAVEFALVVEGWTQKQRQSCLDRFYGQRRNMLIDASAGKVHAPSMMDEAGDEQKDIAPKADGMASAREAPLEAKAEAKAGAKAEAIAEAIAENKDEAMDDEFTDDEL
jgi:SNF2 family DNA or RNA helicase